MTGGIVARHSTDYYAVTDSVVSEALKYISNNISESISVTEIARSVSVSPRNLQRRFQDHLGRAVGEEIRRLRIATAKRLLVNPDFSIKEVAWQTGFCDAKGLRQVFQRELGLSPSQFRKEHLNPPTEHK